MKVIYLNHSGFLLEWENCYWIFDYYKGEIPELDKKKDIFVFCSHSHGDHFNPAVFSLMEAYSKVTYVFSNELKKKCERLKKKEKMIGISVKDYKLVCGKMSDTTENDAKEIFVSIPEIMYVQSRKNLQVTDSAGNEIRLHTLQSTDCGCAFYIEYLNKCVYHAGDLHWWYWSGEPEDWNKKMTADYKKEMEYLEGKRIDLAFTPLDPRQGEEYAWGMNYLLGITDTGHVFPMHFWDDFSVMGRYLKENEVPEATEFHVIESDGQEFYWEWL